MNSKLSIHQSVLQIESGELLAEFASDAMPRRGPSQRKTQCTITTETPTYTRLSYYW